MPFVSISSKFISKVMLCWWDCERNISFAAIQNIKRVVLGDVLRILTQTTSLYFESTQNATQNVLTNILWKCGHGCENSRYSWISKWLSQNTSIRHTTYTSWKYNCWAFQCHLNHRKRTRTHSARGLWSEGVENHCLGDLHLLTAQLSGHCGTRWHTDYRSLWRDWNIRTCRRF